MPIKAFSAPDLSKEYWPAIKPPFYLTVIIKNSNIVTAIIGYLR
jgi:hypothetical protein